MNAKKQKLGPNQKSWIKALRSGKYKQGKDYLHQRTGEMCCLGVACSVVGMKGKPVLAGVKRIPVFQYGTEKARSPFTVMRKLALRDELGEFKGATMGTIECLTVANDSGITFAEIADFCEAHPEAVFTEAR